ncbi:ABC transporter permease subunit [Veronia pacifica]|uniref:Peptide ABC transporter permease n=1 Tax=Veronia pacifica TaxID=1080227 RepID=A0A1C3ES39_9GAMM|nr:ABC transporter permease subunit [Veronia pacifica]ODA36050.1 peptide ABC transporter permease [Veronia pacifica]
MFKFSPLTQKKINSFKSIKRGYYSLLILSGLLILSLFGELLVNNRALVVSYNGELSFPVFSDIRKGTDFGLGYPNEPNYRELRETFKQEGGDNFVIMPLVPYDAFEQDYTGAFPPLAPSIESQHYLGTDTLGRDMVARLLYGFRIAMTFALFTVAISTVIGIVVGCSMGFFGGKFDIIAQRFIEVWSMLPFLYVIMIVVSIFSPSFSLFVLINVLFGWVGITWAMRTMTYKESTREYVMAARALGASTSRILFKHILPNTMVVVVTATPFAIVSALTTLTALDFLGLGLQAPTPSWGDLLQQGRSNLHAPWIVASVVTALVLVLVMVTFVGEAVRTAFDPKKFTRYV